MYRFIRKLQPMKLAPLTLVLVTALVTTCWSQSRPESGRNSKAENPPKNQVLYDPLFWSRELRLSQVQKNKIQEINSAFYEQVRSAAAHYAANNAPSRTEVVQYLHTRSDEIWNTFNVRQKRKWEKIESL